MNKQELVIKVDFDDLVLEVKPNAEHKWLLTTKEVAEGYGVSEIAIRQHKNRNSDELLENIHFISVTNSNSNPRAGIPHVQTLWTREGVIMLGFFIKSERAKIFRKWASKLILNHLEKQNEAYVTKAYLHETLADFKEEFSKEMVAIAQEVGKAIYTLTHQKFAQLNARIELLEAQFEAYFSARAQLDSRSKVAYVYVFHKVGTNEYKIGKSIDPLARKKQLEQGGIKLELVLSMQFKSEELALVWENTLHQTFKTQQSDREWFVLDQHNLSYLFNLAKLQEQIN